MSDICSVTGCGSATHAKGWCAKHYRRWRRHGDPTLTLRPGVDDYPIAILLAQVLAVPGDCWEWGGSIDPHGYGRQGHRLAHRLVYERMVGPIPDGLDIDHLCRVRCCVNPKHLEPVTRQTNHLRGVNQSAVLHVAGVCLNGHDLNEHAYRRKTTGNVVYCRVCRNDKRRASR